MRIKVFNTFSLLADAAADSILAVIRSKPNALLCLATGNTPTLTYERLAARINAANVDVSTLRFVALDEWVGVPPETPGTCAAYLAQHIFDPLGINPSQVHLFDALNNDLESECRKTDAFIKEHGGIDLMVLGIGMNGHLGFNEPGTKPTYSHVVELDEITRTVGQKYFREAVTIERGITQGLKSILESRSVLLLANGRHKAEIVKAVSTSEPVETLPATILHRHPDCRFFLDSDAAELLGKESFAN